MNQKPQIAQEHISDLSLISKKAMEAGKKMDLSDCPYGETTGPCTFIKRPANYYFFLAGFVRTQKLRSILEIGTNFGGAIMSMFKGLDPTISAKPEFVTVDLITKNEAGFKRFMDIKRVIGDSLSNKTVQKVRSLFSKRIDLLYIDSVHRYFDTKKNIELYGGMLDPKYIILDDIRQCTEMKRLWKELRIRYGSNVYDASEVAIRKGAGFGVIKKTDTATV